MPARSASLMELNGLTTEGSSPADTRAGASTRQFPYE
jgi:hypothetical protein